MPHPHRPTTRKGWAGLGTAVLIFLAFVILGTVCYSYAKERTTVAVVLDKDRVCESGGKECKYLIFTDETTFRITDYIGRMTSSDAYGRIIPCHRYQIKYYGFRFGWTSSYPNIKEATDLGEVEGCRPRR